MMASRPASKNRLHILILAAGKGKRMRSDRIKLLHVLGGSPVICHVARAAMALKPDLLAAVVGHQADEVKAVLLQEPGLAGSLNFITQPRQLGTGHAVLQAETQLRSRARSGRCDLLILNGDVPLIRPATLRRLVVHHRRTLAAVTALSTVLEEPSGYGRIVRDGSEAFVSIVEQCDATRAQAMIREINAGIYCADEALLFKVLKATGRDNAQQEYYLPDVFRILRCQGARIEAYRHPEAEEVLGVNDRGELARVGKALYRRRAEELMRAGVTIVDPDCTYIDPGVKVGRDTVIHPMVHLEGFTRIGAGSSIGRLTHIIDSRLGDGVKVLDMCVINQSRVARGVRIGPFAHLRPGAVLEDDVHVGNFVEIKKSRLGKNTKAAHLSYLGDAEIGQRCNIGAGTITCNYDGIEKLPTKLEDDVFIGSDTQLVAPVTIKRGAYIGAGSTISKDVPAYALALTRADLRVKKNWAKRKQKRAPSKAGGAGSPTKRTTGRGGKD